MTETLPKGSFYLTKLDYMAKETWLYIAVSPYVAGLLVLIFENFSNTYHTGISLILIAWLCLSFYLMLFNKVKAKMKREKEAFLRFSSEGIYLEGLGDTPLSDITDIVYGLGKVVGKSLIRRVYYTLKLERKNESTFSYSFLYYEPETKDQQDIASFVDTYKELVRKNAKEDGTEMQEKYFTNEKNLNRLGHFLTKVGVVLLSAITIYMLYIMIFS